jgi:hypothetical protein
MSGPTAWVFDVDATIVDGMSGRVLRPLVRETFAAVVARGHHVVLWSAGGADYAQRTADDHAIADLVSACFGKDVRTAEGSFDIGEIAAEYHVHCFVDDLDTDAPATHQLVRVQPYLGGSVHDRGLVPVLDRLAAVR